MRCTNFCSYVGEPPEAGDMDGSYVVVCCCLSNRIQDEKVFVVYPGRQRYMCHAMGVSGFGQAGAGQDFLKGGQDAGSDQIG